MANWAEGPFKLIVKTGIQTRPEIPAKHPAVLMAKSMALTHNVILRSLNASHHHCLGIHSGTARARDFLYYNQSLCEVLNIHHDVEEEYLFPEIGRLTGDPHLMNNNLQEHQDFHVGLKDFQDYVYNTKPENYNGRELQRLLQAFGSSVEAHLHHEIPTLLYLHQYDGQKLAQISKEMTKRTISHSDKFRYAFGALLRSE
jgi:hemerythrin-like domain-containing protein